MIWVSLTISFTLISQTWHQSFFGIILFFFFLFVQISFFASLRSYSLHAKNKCWQKKGSTPPKNHMEYVGVSCIETLSCNGLFLKWTKNRRATLNYSENLSPSFDQSIHINTLVLSAMCRKIHYGWFRRKTSLSDRILSYVPQARCPTLMHYNKILSDGESRVSIPVRPGWGISTVSGQLGLLIFSQSPFWFPPPPVSL